MTTPLSTRAHAVSRSARNVQRTLVKRVASVALAGGLLALGLADYPPGPTATSRVGLRDAGVGSAVLNSAQQIGASLGTAVLNTVAAAATAAYLTAEATAALPDALVHGYDTAAVWAAVFLIVGAMVALSSPPRHGEICKKMTQSPVRSARLRRQARLMNVINVPMRLLLRPAAICNSAE